MKCTKSLERVNPYIFAKSNRHISVNILLETLTRLNAMYFQQKEAAIGLECRFGYDVTGNCLVSGEFVTHLGLECQRCMNFMEYPVSAKFSLSPIECGDEINYDKQNDYVLTKDGYINLIEMIEDEILLLIPDHPKHISNFCI